MAVYGMNLVYKSNRMRRLKKKKKRTGFGEFFAWKYEKGHFMEISGKSSFYKNGPKWKETPCDEKIRCEYESTYVKT